MSPRSMRSTLATTFVSGVSVNKSPMVKFVVWAVVIGMVLSLGLVALSAFGS